MVFVPETERAHADLILGGSGERHENIRTDAGTSLLEHLAAIMPTDTHGYLELTLSDGSYERTSAWHVYRGRGAYEEHGFGEDPTITVPIGAARGLTSSLSRLVRAPVNPPPDQLVRNRWNAKRHRPASEIGSIRYRSASEKHHGRERIEAVWLNDRHHVFYYALEFERLARTALATVGKTTDGLTITAEPLALEYVSASNWTR